MSIPMDIFTFLKVLLLLMLTLFALIFGQMIRLAHATRILGRYGVLDFLFDAFCILAILIILSLAAMIGLSLLGLF